MRIAYLVVWSGGPDTGVGRKILAQTAAWTAAGHEVILAVLTRDAAWSTLTVPHALCAAVWRGPFSLIRAWGGLRRAILGWKPNVLYARQTIWLPGLGALLRAHPSAIEIQTDDFGELDRHAWKGRWNRATRGWMLSACRGLVFMTDELSRLPHYAIFAKSPVVIANALPVVEPLVHAPTLRPRLLFIGTPGQDWHGEDKLVRLAGLLPECDIDIVGSLAAPGMERHANVSWHGWLKRSEYLHLVAQASVGIGTLALHRKGMEEACALKVREYLAHGLPTIIGNRDTDFPHDAPFLLRVPNREDNITTHVEEIRDFTKQWHNRRFDVGLVAHLVSARKEEIRLGFLCRLLEEG